MFLKPLCPGCRVHVGPYGPLSPKYNVAITRTCVPSRLIFVWVGAVSIPSVTSSLSDLEEGEQQPGFMLCTSFFQTISHEAKDVWMLEEAMHVCLSLRLFLVLLLMTQDSLQGVEVSIM